MEKYVYLNELYDLYGELLTDKQRLYFESYYFNNLSYGEIGEKYNVSRNAIYHQLQLIEKKLKISIPDYEPERLPKEDLEYIIDEIYKFFILNARNA